MSRYENWTYQDFEKMPSKQLEEILQQDLVAKEPEMLPVESIKQILQILRQRKIEAGTYKPVDVNVAWDRFRAEHLDKTNGGPDTSLCLMPKQNRNHIPWFRHKIAVIAAVICLFFAITITAQACGFDIFGVFARWTDEIFQFDIASDGQTNSETNDMLQSDLEESGLVEALIPTWYPDGFEMGETSISENGNGKSCSIPFVHPDGRFFSIRIRKYVSTDIVNSMVIEKSQETVDVYQHGSFVFYIMKNLDFTTAVWTDGLIVETITGNLTYEEIKAMIDSIGG